MRLRKPETPARAAPSLLESIARAPPPPGDHPLPCCNTEISIIVEAQFKKTAPAIPSSEGLALVEARPNRSRHARRKGFVELPLFVGHRSSPNKRVKMRGTACPFVEIFDAKEGLCHEPGVVCRIGQGRDIVIGAVAHNQRNAASRLRGRSGGCGHAGGRQAEQHESKEQGGICAHSFLRTCFAGTS